METELTRKVNKNGMIISRIPSWAKKIIKDVSEEENCGDYGACIAQFVRDALEYQALKQKFFNNDLNIDLVINNKNEEKLEEPEEKIKFANGKKLKKEVKK